VARAAENTCGVRGESIERVVIVFPGALGDLLLALPALRVLRARHRRARLTLVVPGPLCGLAAAAIAGDVASLDDADAARLFAPRGLPRWLADRPVLYSWLGGGDRSLRTRIAGATRAAHFFRVVRGAGAEHASAEYLAAVGGQTAGGPVDARIRPPRSPRAAELRAALSGPLLAVHPGAGARAKRWDAAGFARVVAWWRHAGGAVAMIAGPAEAGDAVPAGVAEVRDWPLPDVAALLADATLYLGNDSGISHLAGAVGAPGVVLFGPTDAWRWRPSSRRITVLQAHSSYPDGFDVHALPAERVLAACRRRVRGLAPGVPAA
jgi:ADP-heptose:LPS heptosyltransferase